MASIGATSCPTNIAWRGKKTSRKRLRPSGDRRQANGRASSTNYFGYSVVQFQLLTGGGQVPHSVGVCLRSPSLSLSLCHIWFPIGWRPFTFSIQPGQAHASYKLPPLALFPSLALFGTFSLPCAFRTRSLQTFSNWNFSMVSSLPNALAAEQPQKRISTLGRCGCLKKMLTLAANSSNKTFQK